MEAAFLPDDFYSSIHFYFVISFAAGKRKRSIMFSMCDEQRGWMWNDGAFGKSGRTVKQPLVGERARDRGTIRNTMSNELSSERTGANDSETWVSGVT